MAGVTLHVSFCSLVRTTSNTILFHSDKAEGELRENVVRQLRE